MANRYYKYITRYFLAEGAANGHSLCLAGSTTDNMKLIKSIPRVVSAPHEQQAEKKRRDKGKVAWLTTKHKFVNSTRPT
jgi:hypothetical protein